MRTRAAYNRTQQARSEVIAMLGLSRVFLMLLIVTTVLHAIGSFRPTLRRIGFWADQGNNKILASVCLFCLPHRLGDRGQRDNPATRDGRTPLGARRAGPTSIFGVHCGALAATIRQCALGRCKELKIWGTFVVTVWIRYIPLDIGKRFVIHN